MPTKPRGRRRPQATALRAESPAFKRHRRIPTALKFSPANHGHPGIAVRIGGTQKPRGEIWHCPREPRWDRAASLLPGTPSRARTSMTVTAINTHAN